MRDAADLSDRYRRLFLEDHPIDRDVSDEHSRIVHATLDGKADEACELLRQHIDRTGKNVLSALMQKTAAAGTPARRGQGKLPERFSASATLAGRTPVAKKT